MELWGSETGLDSRTERPTCRLAWPPTCCQLRATGWQCGQGARVGGKHFIKRKCCYNGGTETSTQCSIRGHWARFPLPDCATPQSWEPKGLSQRTPGACRGDSVPPESSPQLHTHHSPECLLVAFTPSIWGS